MPIILLHSSKTMRPPGIQPGAYQQPAFLNEATELNNYLRTLSLDQLASCMHISDNLAAANHTQIEDWTTDSNVQSPAIDSFLGDIYSGLQTQSLTVEDRDYANRHLIILSGLYGGLRALDSIYPYRLEMGYRLPDEPYRSLYKFWGDKIAHLLRGTDFIVNASAAEYTKAALPFLTDIPIITPKFLTQDLATNTPKFVTVHTKITRGAFARWMITERIANTTELQNFSDLGYNYHPELSTAMEPVFVCENFQGLGLSVRRNQ